MKEELDSYGIKFYAVQRERDLLKLKCEKYESLLKEKGIAFESSEEEEDEKDMALVDEF